MSLADTIECYAAALLPWFDEPAIYTAIDALLARDAAAGWWRMEAT